jgi:methionine synthase I (cobalamin-dependent)/5,10-methylenetetrahydrofolate reductase
MSDFLKTLKDEGILADGAMGTELYSRGFFINRCFDELNLTNPKVIGEIHRDYIKAGAGLIETNTFTASRPALASFGLEDKVRDINLAGAEIAKKAAGGDVFVAGSLGPASWAHKETETLEPEELRDIFREQISVLAEGGIDAILLETFTHLEELHLAYEAAREACKLPVITQVSLKYVGEGEFTGLLPEIAAAAMDGWGADVIGVNCSDGPQGVFEAMKRMIGVTRKPLSAMPNAGLPKQVHGRLLYLASPEYMAEYARRYAQLGVSLIGGCCGTTPAHIREMKRFLKTLTPAARKLERARVEEVERAPVKPVSEIPPAQKSSFGATLGNKFSVSVEIDPPYGINTEKAIDGARLLKDIGVDGINIADGPRAMARMSPIALAIQIKQKAGIDPIVHYCCRDRNLLGMQMDLLGAAALGLANILIITGDPPKMGHYPDATAVFDIDSVGLIHFVHNLNRGMDFAERPIAEPTSFLIGCGVNTGAVDVDLEADRFKQKIAAGAEFAFSQPVYDLKMLETFFDRIGGPPPIPFFIGILPLASFRNAEFLHNEVPGMQIPGPIMERMEKAGTRQAQRDVGLSVAKDVLEVASGLAGIGGAYIFPPFGDYGKVGELMKVIR